MEEKEEEDKRRGGGKGKKGVDGSQPPPCVTHYRSTNGRKLSGIRGGTKWVSPKSEDPLQDIMGEARG